MLKKLITVAGLAGTLGVAAPAFADWYQPAPAPVTGMPVQQPGYAYGYDGDDDRDDWRRRDDDWRRDEWRRHEAWERYRRWRRYEWMRHHHYYQNW